MNKPKNYDVLINQAEQIILLELSTLKSKANILKMLKATNDDEWGKTHDEALRTLAIQ